MDMESLAQAIETLQNGDSVLGVYPEHVEERVLNDGEFYDSLMQDLHAGELSTPVKNWFQDLFEQEAEEMILEAYATHKEQQEGLM